MRWLHFNGDVNHQRPSQHEIELARGYDGDPWGCRQAAIWNENTISRGRMEPGYTDAESLGQYSLIVRIPTYQGGM